MLFRFEPLGEAISSGRVVLTLSTMLKLEHAAVHDDALVEIKI